MIEVPVNYRKRQGTSKITGEWKGMLSTGFRMILLIWSERFRNLDPSLAQATTESDSLERSAEKVVANGDRRLR
jgi:hypothetical protein